MAEAKTQMEKPAHGTFCWMELSSENVEACKKFYGELFGWNLKQSNAVPGFEYTEFGVGEERIGGMFQITDECREAAQTPMKSHWMSYVAVDDVDAAATKVFELGGKICVPPMDIPNVGRFCVVDDPSGATLSLLTLKGAS